MVILEIEKVKVIIMRKPLLVLLFLSFILAIPAGAFAWVSEGSAEWHELPESIQKQLPGEESFLYCYVNQGTYTLNAKLDEENRVVYVFQPSGQNDGSYWLDVKSAPLPHGEEGPVFMGTDGTSHLLLSPDGGYSNYYFSRFSDGTWRLGYVQARYDFSIDYIFGLQYDDYDTGDDRCLPGDWPDYSLETMDIHSLPSHKDEAIEAIDYSQYALVTKPSRDERHHLYAMPSEEAYSLGEYYGGTPARVLLRDGEWAHVDICGVEGYMLLDGLTFGLDMLDVEYRFPYMSLLEGFEEQAIKVYSKPIAMESFCIGMRSNIEGNLGTSFLGNVGDDWFHIACSNDLTGYVQAEYFYDYMAANAVDE